MHTVYLLGQGGITRREIAEELDMVVSTHLSKLINSLIEDGFIEWDEDRDHYPMRYLYYPTAKLQQRMVGLGYMPFSRHHRCFCVTAHGYDFCVIPVNKGQWDHVVYDLNAPDTDRLVYLEYFDTYLDAEADVKGLIKHIQEGGEIE